MDARHDLLLLHASRAAVEPVAEFYQREAADLRPLNLLDDGIMGLLRSGDWDAAVVSLARHLDRAVETYGVRSALLTCSALRPRDMEALRGRVALALRKIDEPMLHAAATAGGRVGLLATFPATVETSAAWLRHANPEVDLETECEAGALDALLQGRQEHDQRLVEAARRLADRGAQRLVLAQVSMVRLAERVALETGLPVHESLRSSLSAVRMIS